MMCGCDGELLNEFCKWAFENHVGRYNALCPKEFTSANDVYNMMTKPLADLMRCIGFVCEYYL